MKTTLDKIRNQIIGAPRYSVSPELDRKVQGALGWQKMSPIFKLEPEEGLLFPAITQWLMKSLKQYAFAVAAIAIAFGGVWYYTQNSYSYHLEKAKVALVELKDVLAGKPAQTAFIPSAFAEEVLPSVNEALVTQLATTVVQETEKAIDIAEAKTDPVVVQQALSEISVVQNQTVPVLAEATVAVTTASATETISIALQITTTDQSIVQKALDFVAQATLKGDTQVSIDIQTSADDKEDKEDKKEDKDGKDDDKDGDEKGEEKTDEQKATEAKANLELAKALVEQMKTAKVDQEDIDKILKKIKKAEEALKEGEMGRAYGLSTAALAQGKHLLKEAKEEAEGDEEEDRDEKKDEDRKDDEGKDEDDDRDEDKKNDKDEKKDKDEDRKGDEDEDREGEVEEKSKPALPSIPRLGKEQKDEEEDSDSKSEKSSEDRDGEKSEKDDD